MPKELQAVFALALLIPGFVSARIVRMMSQKTQQSELERVIDALILTFFTYLAYIPLYFAYWHTLPFALSSTHDFTQYYYFGGDFGVTAFGWRLLWIPAIAVVLGLVWGFVREKDLLLKSLRTSKMTQRSAYESVWADVLQYLGGNVRVGLGDGSEVIGWLRQYSLADGERTLLLQNASSVAGFGTTKTVPGDGLLLLTEKAEIKYVMFLDEGQAKGLPSFGWDEVSGPKQDNDTRDENKNAGKISAKQRQ